MFINRPIDEFVLWMSIATCRFVGFYSLRRIGDVSFKCLDV